MAAVMAAAGPGPARVSSCGGARGAARSEGCAVSLVGEVVKCVGFAFVSHGVSGDGVVSAPFSLLKNSDFFFSCFI